MQNYKKGAELRFRDFKRCIKKGSKSIPTSNKYQDKIYIYIPNTYLHTPTGLFLHHMQKPTVAENPTIIFAVSQVSQNTRLAAALDCRNKVLKYERQGHSFHTRYNNTHTHTLYIYIYRHAHTHTLCLSFSPRVSVPKAGMGSINCYTRISVT